MENEGSNSRLSKRLTKEIAAALKKKKLKGGKKWEPKAQIYTLLEGRSMIIFNIIIKVEYF